MTNEDDFWNNLFADILPAVKRFEEMLKNNKQYYFEPETLDDIYSYYFNSGEIASAANVAQFGINQNPFTANFYLRKAQATLAEGGFEEARLLLQKAMAYEPTNFEIMLGMATLLDLESNGEEAEHYLEQALNHAGEDFAMVYLAYANLYMSEDRFKEAQPWLEKLVLADAEFDDSIHDLNMVYHQLEIFQVGIKFFNNLLDKNPFLSDAWYALGTLYNRTENFESAHQAFDFATTLNESLTLAWFNWGNVYINEDNFVEALKVFEIAFKLEPDNAFVACGIGVCFENLSLFEKALEWYTISADLDNTSADPFFGLGVCHIHLENYELALHNLQRAIGLESDNPDFWHQMGEAYFGLERFSEAIDAYKKTLSIDADFEDAYFDLVFTQLNFLDEKAEACTNFENFKPSAPHSSDYLYKTAAFYFAVNKRTMAMETLQVALLDNINNRNVLFEWYPNAETDLEILDLIETYIR